MKKIYRVWRVGRKAQTDQRVEAESSLQARQWFQSLNGGDLMDIVARAEGEAVSKIDYEAAFYADVMAPLSADQLATRVRAIDEEIERLPYAPLRVNIEARGAGLRVERRYYEAELKRRLAG